MASVNFQSVSKRFGSHLAVSDVSFMATAGEFLALLGPSGCGKTTVLRLIAGFEAPSEGRIGLGDRVVAQAGGPVIAPEHRGIGMVFQSYALWPHMSVADNVGFALKLRRLSATERARRVNDTLALVGLADMADRRPQQLSGGQRQRVALARCLAMEPGVILLDEPLANLDANLREAMQQEFKRLHRETGATFIYVTHDQAEAMMLADRVAVMSEGRIEQLAAPRTLYAEPRSAMVAQFVGAGMVCPVQVLGADGDGVRVSLFGSQAKLRGAGHAGEQRLASLRANDLTLADGPAQGFPAVVRDLGYQGAFTTVAVSLAHDATHTLRINHAGPPPALGATVHVGVRDGWLLAPESA